MLALSKKVCNLHSLDIKAIDVSARAVNYFAKALTNPDCQLKSFLTSFDFITRRLRLALDSNKSLVRFVGDFDDPDDERFAQKICQRNAMFQ